MIVWLGCFQPTYLGTCVTCVAGGFIVRCTSYGTCGDRSFLDPARYGRDKPIRLPIRTLYVVLRKCTLKICCPIFFPKQSTCGVHYNKSKLPAFPITTWIPPITNHDSRLYSYNVQSRYSQGQGPVHHTAAVSPKMPLLP